MADSSPLAGLRVLDLSSVGPASRCSRILADYGAEVVKVSPPPSKKGLQIEPAAHAYSGNRYMKRLRVDLKSDDGRGAFLARAAASDVVIESFRPGVMARLGLGYEDLAGANPGLVYCSTSGYGQTGPYAGWAGHDLNYLGVAGFLDCSSPRADGGPPIPGATVADSAGGGMHAALSIMAGLLARAGTGQGCYLDVSATEGALSLMSLHIDERLATGVSPGPGSNVLTGRYAWYDCYRAADGRWLSVAAIEPAFWANLCRALGLEKWIDSQYDDRCQDQIREDLGRAFGGRGRDEWVAELGPADTCVAPGYSVSELSEDPQLRDRGNLQAAVSPEDGEFEQLAAVLAGSIRETGAVALPLPGSTDTDALLLAAGLEAEDIERMKKEGILA